MAAPVEILVCQDGSCQRAGSRAVLLEIEELTRAIDHCRVRAAGCLGACGAAPNAIVLVPAAKRRKETLCTCIRDIKQSAAVVRNAIGMAPDLDKLDPEIMQRLVDARQKKEKFENKQDKRVRKKQQGSYIPPEPAVPSSSYQFALAESVGQVASRCRNEGHAIPSRHTSHANVVDSPQPKMDAYAKWLLEGFTVVSKHSAIFHFSSMDDTRSTPNPRKRWRLGSAKTWHTTLLANVRAKQEGASSWIERDYTPISSWREWEEGRCDILIKIYNNGLVTSWLHKEQLGCEILLSQPKKTLDVPSLVPDRGEATLPSPTSVLLVLAGTGIVVASQVLHHADSSTSFGPSPEMTAPISLIYSCRKDDVLMIKDLTGWCESGKLERCTLTMTEPDAESELPFPDFAESDLDLSDLARLTNVTLIFSRLSLKLLDNELRLLKKPCRVVVSGPALFNSAVKGMLSRTGIDQESITILSA